MKGVSSEERFKHLYPDLDFFNSDRTWKREPSRLGGVATYHLYHENETLRPEISTNDLAWKAVGAGG